MMLDASRTLTPASGEPWSIPVKDAFLPEK
jgi:hypothetical protein